MNIQWKCTTNNSQQKQINRVQERLQLRLTVVWSSRVAEHPPPIHNLPCGKCSRIATQMQIGIMDFLVVRSLAESYLYLTTSEQKPLALIFAIFSTHFSQITLQFHYLLHNALFTLTTHTNTEPNELRLRD